MDKKLSLSDVLRAATNNKNGIDKNKIYFIGADEVYPHPDNEKFYKKITTENLTDLKESIVQMGGVIEPLVVKKAEDGRLYIISGNRRRQAVMELFDEGRIKSRLVPYKIREFKDKDEELKSIILLNSQRKKSILEEKNEIVFLYNFYKKEKEEKNIKGNTREYTAGKIGISQTKLQRYLNIDNLSEKLRQKLDNEEIGFSVASEFMSMDYETQDRILDELKDDLTVSSVREAKKALGGGKDEENKEDIPAEDADKPGEPVDKTEPPDGGKEPLRAGGEEEKTDVGGIRDIPDAEKEGDDEYIDNEDAQNDENIPGGAQNSYDDPEDAQNPKNGISDSPEGYWKKIIKTHIMVLKDTLSDSVDFSEDRKKIQSIIKFGEGLMEKCTDEKTGNNKI